jgi:hypothetical protein
VRILGIPVVATAFSVVLLPTAQGASVDGRHVLAATRQRREWP